MPFFCFFFKGLGKGRSAGIQPRCTWSSLQSPRRILLLCAFLPSLLATQGQSNRWLKAGRRSWDSPVQQASPVQTHLGRVQPLSSKRLEAAVRWRKVQRENCHSSSHFNVYFEPDAFFSLWQQVLRKHLLPQLCNFLRLQSSLQPGQQTQGRLHVSWLKGGGKPESSESERSRSVCKGRRRRGNKQDNPPEIVQRT